jgi:hypothetical protein
VQTLTLMMSGVELLMFSAATLKSLQDQIKYNDDSLREKIESNDKLTQEKMRSLRNECKMEVEKSKAESARIAMEYQLKYNHSEEYVSLRRPESSTAVASSSVISIPPEPLN